MSRIATITFVTLTALTLARPASADSVTCSSTINGGTLPNVVVPAGQTCFIMNATINGNEVGEIDSKTFIVSTTINGNVEGQDAEMVQLINVIVNGNVGIVGGEVDDISPFTFDYAICGTHVTGNVSITGSGGDAFVYTSPSCGPRTTRVDGNLLIGGNSARVRVIGVIVGRNATIVNNTSATEKTIINNAIGKNLTCSGNTEPLTVDSNTAAKLIGQCAG
jgi:hypothetical protein